MKKILYFAALLFTFAVTSCEKEDIGSTATENTAGQWYVSVDGVDADGEVIDGFEDFFFDGRTLILTYNTSANSATEMIVDDLKQIWNFKVKVACDQAARTFATTVADDEENNLRGDDINVKIWGGKILPGAGRQNNGSPADSIVFYVTFSDDPYPAKYGHSGYKVSGVRYSGLKEND